MNADRKILIDTFYDAIDDEANGTTCLFPVDGAGSIAAIVEQYGDDIEVVMQGATWFLQHSGDGNTWALEDVNGRPFVGSSAGIFPSRSGDLWEDPNGDDLIATESGWVSTDEADVHTYGAVLA